MPALVRSPLLIARGARSAGRRGGRRIEVHAEGSGFRVEVRGDVSRQAFAPDELAAVQHFNRELREGLRAGLTAVPEPVELTCAALAAARRA